GMLGAFRALRALRPQVVFGTGGFVALPVMFAAAVSRVPIVLHEQTAVPGLANRIGARFARRIAVTFPDKAGRFPASRVVVTGNPLRPELRSGSRASAIARFQLDLAVPLVYVTGGALGAHRINRVVGQPLPGTSGDEQTETARLVERAGGAVVLPQSMLTAERLEREVRALVGDPARLKQMGEHARTLGVPDAAKRIVAVLTEFCR